jgi:hypothetical protein
MANTYLTRTGVTPTISNKYTFSCWIKRGAIGTTETIFRTYSDSNNSAQLIFDSDDTFAFQDIIGGTTVTNLKPSNLFRDTGAWMNIIVQVDYTQAVAADRAKIFINGAEVSYSATTVQSEGGASMLNTANNNALGSNRSNSSHYFTGSMSHVNFIDGTAYPATAFGSVDATSGIWKINTAPSVTYGNNGFFTLRDGNTITDSSPNSNNFSLGGGTLTNTEDCPDNNFATMNPLDNFYFGGSYANGNTTLTTDATKYGYTTGTVGSSKGKYYWEMKLIQASGGNYHITGVAAAHQGSGDGLGYVTDGYAYQGYDGKIRANGSVSNYGNTWTTNDIIGTAIDLDNNKLYFSKNGTFQNSGDPTSGATGTGAFALTASASTSLGAYLPATGDHGGASYAAAIYSYNFGNGHFGTTAVASAGTNASGNGIFEYDVPTGYTSLSTKGLNL